MKLPNKTIKLFEGKEGRDNLLIHSFNVFDFYHLTGSIPGYNMMIERILDSYISYLENCKQFAEEFVDLDIDIWHSIWNLNYRKCTISR